MEDKYQSNEKVAQKGGSEIEQLDINPNKKSYVLKVLNPLLEDMVMDSLFCAPLDKDPTPYLLAWTKVRKAEADKGMAEARVEKDRLMMALNVCKQQVDNLQDAVLQNSAKEDAETKEESEEEEDDELISDSELAPMAQKKERTSVSAEAYGAWNKKTAFKAPVYKKDDDQKARLENTLKKSFMFMNLDEKELNTVIDACQEVVCEEGETLIKQGDDGDFLVVVEAGIMECRKDIDGVDTFLTTKETGDVVGELALLYNAPRAANVKATTRSVLWKLDRDSFNNIVKDAAQKKREKYEKFLASVELLSKLDAYNRSQIADGLQVETFAAGEDIITQGETGDKFYIIEEGEASCFKDGSKVMAFQPGMFFGELALLKNEPRAASVKADTALKCLTLSRDVFKRLFGGAAELETLAAHARQSYNA